MRTRRIARIKCLLRINLFSVFSVVIITIAPSGLSFADSFERIVSDLASPDRKSRLSAVEALGKIGDDGAVDALMRYIESKDDDWRITVRAIRLLGETRNPKTADLLMDVFSDPFFNNECPAIKWNTARALGNFPGDSRIVEALIGALGYDNLLVREAVVESLGDIGDSRALPFLVPLLGDRSFAIRLSAIRAIEKIGDPKAVPFLEPLLADDEDPLLREEALSAARSLLSGRKGAMERQIME